MASHLKSNKLIPPTWQDQISRPRLLKLIDKVKQKRVVMVIAPAGYGKTILAADLVTRSRTPVCWYHLEDEDSCLGTFVRHLTASFHRRFPHYDTVVGQAPLPATTEWERLRHLAGLLAEEVRSQIDCPFIIVLDDLQAIETARPVLFFLEAAIELLPANVHWLLLSRSRSPLALARLAAQRQLVTITGEQMAFTEEETRLLGRRLGRNLSRMECSTLREATEGWAAALVLAMDLYGRNAHSRQHRLLPGIPRERLFAYLADEVFNRLPIALQDFLVKTSILEVLDPKMLDVFLETDRSREFLNEMARRNLFVFPLDTALGRYRYHNLFAAFLQEKFRSRAREGELAHLHRRAAEIFLLHGAPVAALTHFLAAQAWDEAVPLMAQLADRQLLLPDCPTVVGWLNKIPADTAQTADLIYVKARVAHASERHEQLAELYSRALTAYEIENDVAGLVRTLTHVIACSGAIHFPGGPATAERFAAHPDQRVAILGRIWLYLLQFNAGQVGPGIHGLTALGRELEAAAAAGAPDLHAMSLVLKDTLSIMHFLAGDYDACLRHGLEVVRNNPDPAYWFRLNVWGAYFCLGDEAGMEQLLADLRRWEARGSAPAHARLQICLGTAMLSILRHEDARALAALEAVRPYFNNRSSVAPVIDGFTTIVAQTELARLYAGSGRKEEARAHLRQNLNLAGRGHWLAPLARAQLAAFLAEEGKLADALHLLEEAEAIAADTGFLFHRLIVGTARVRVELAAGRPASARASLAPLIALAEASNAAGLLAHYGGPPIAPLVAELAAKGNQRAFLQTLLRRMTA